MVQRGRKLKQTASQPIAASTRIRSALRDNIAIRVLRAHHIQALPPHPNPLLLLQQGPITVVTRGQMLKQTASQPLAASTRIHSALRDNIAIRALRAHHIQAPPPHPNTLLLLQQGPITVVTRGQMLKQTASQPLAASTMIHSALRDYIAIRALRAQRQTIVALLGII